MRNLVIDVLAATRLTRLVIEDTFPPVKAVRDRIVERHTTEVPAYYRDENDELHETGTTKQVDSWAELITCPWCAGMWVSLGVIVVRRYFPKQWQPLAEALAASMLVGLVESKVDVD